eukprot:m51a1_g88 hypothetical protein (170) ;mRNA; f:281999-282508
MSCCAAPERAGPVRVLATPLVASEGLWEDLEDLRFDVLRRPLGMAPTRPHPLDVASSFHALLFADAALQRAAPRRLSGVASCHTEGEGEGCARLYQMAVREELRGSGAGKRIVEAVAEEARRRGFRRLTCHARAGAVGFYEKCGFREYGQRFREINMEHALMELHLVDV